MTSYATGNAVPSTDARDLLDNAANLDDAMHTSNPTWTDRLGVARPSWAGMSSYQVLGDYAVGIVLSQRNQVVLQEGEYWKIAAGVALPYTTSGVWATDDEDFVAVGDAVLRQELADAETEGAGEELVAIRQSDREVASGAPIVLKFTQRGDIRRYGAVQGQDNHDALEAAANCGHEMFIPDTLDGLGWETYTPFRARDYLSIRGESPRARLFNLQATSAEGEGQVMILGTFQEAFAADDAIYYDLAAVVRGRDYVTASPAVDAGEFARGDLVYLWNDAGYSASGRFIPAHQQISEVAVDGNTSTGRIYLRDRVKRSCATGGRITKMADPCTDVHSQDILATKHVRISNVRVYSEFDAWTRWGGMYRHNWDSLIVERGTNIVALNGMAHCQVNRVQGFVTRRFFEFGYFCHDVLIDGFDVGVHEGETLSADLGAVTWGEGTHDVRVLHGNIDFGDGGAACMAAKFGQGSKNNRMSEVTVRATQLSMIVRAANTEAATMDYGQNVVADCTFDVEECTTDVISVLCDENTDLVDLTVRDSVFVVPTIGSDLFSIKGKRVAILRNDFGNCDEPATNAIQAAAEEIRIEGNALPALLPVLSQDNCRVTGNTVSGREIVERIDLRFNNASAITSTDSTNSVADIEVPTGALDGGDTFDYELGGTLNDGGGSDTKTVQIVHKGDVLAQFQSTLSGSFMQRGTIVLATNTTATWRALGMEAVNGAAVPYRKTTTSETEASSSDDDTSTLEIRAYVSNSASNIRLEAARLTYRPRY